jgi:hypothetical protein
LLKIAEFLLLQEIGIRRFMRIYEYLDVRVARDHAHGLGDLICVKLKVFSRLLEVTRQFFQIVFDERGLRIILVLDTV